MNETNPPPLPSLPPQPIQPPQTSPLAIWSLVLGILSLPFALFCIGLFLAIPGVICGHIALGKIKKSVGALTGEGLAIAGLVTGYLGIAATLLCLPAIAIPNFVKARQTAQLNQCLNNLRQIDGAKQQWALEHAKPSTATPTAQDLDQYIKGGFASLHCPAGGTYTIGQVGELPTCSVPAHKLP